MTWLKLSDDHADICAKAGLSDAAFRTHVEGLLWAMRRENGGRLSRQDLKRSLETDDPAAAVAELVTAGFWTVTPDGWQIVQAMGDQVEPEVIEARRKADAERQRKYRMKVARLEDPSVSRRDARRDKTRDPGLDGTGLAGSGSATQPKTEGTLPNATMRLAAVNDWPDLLCCRGCGGALDRVLADDGVHPGCEDAA